MDGSARWTITPDATVTSFETSESSLKDPWRIVVGVASSNDTNLRKATSWVSIFASSGVDIPITVFQRFSELLDTFNSPFKDVITLAESIFKTTWIKSIGRLELHALLSDLHVRCASHIMAAEQSRMSNDDMCVSAFPDRKVDLAYQAIVIDLFASHCLPCYSSMVVNDPDFKILD